jgi:hypothetical protein
MELSLTYTASSIKEYTMTPSEVKIKLLEKGIRQADLAKKWKRPMGTVCMLVNRRFKSNELERKLARAIGVSVEELRG